MLSLEQTVQLMNMGYSANDIAAYNQQSQQQPQPQPQPQPQQQQITNEPQIVNAPTHNNLSQFDDYVRAIVADAINAQNQHSPQPQNQQLPQPQNQQLPQPQNQQLPQPQNQQLPQPQNQQSQESGWKDPFNAIMDEISNMRKSIQTENILNSNLPQDQTETTVDILASIINPPIPNNQKGEK